MKNTYLRTLATFVAIMIALSACGAVQDDASPLPSSSPLSPGESPLDKPPEGNVPSKGEDNIIGDVDQLFELARTDLASELGIDPNDIELVKVESVEWSNSSLGCPEEGMMYAQVITPGYQLTLEANGQQYVYHTDSDKRVVHCEQQ